MMTLFPDGFHQLNEGENSSEEGKTKQDDKMMGPGPTAIDVALAATRDLLSQRARSAGAGNYAVRSTMIIRSSQKVRVNLISSCGTI